MLRSSHPKKIVSEYAMGICQTVLKVRTIKYLILMKKTNFLLKVSNVLSNFIEINCNYLFRTMLEAYNTASIGSMLNY